MKLVATITLICLLITIPTTALSVLEGVYAFKQQISDLNQALAANSLVNQNYFENIFGETARKELRDEWLPNLAVTRHVVRAIVAQGSYEWLLIKLLNGKNKSKFVAMCCEGFAEYCTTRKVISERYKKYMGVILGELSKIDTFESMVNDRLLFSNTQKIMGSQKKSSDLVSESIYALLTSKKLAAKKAGILACSPELLRLILASRQNPLSNTSLGGMTPAHYLLSVYAVTQEKNLIYANTIELGENLRGEDVPQVEIEAVQQILEALIPLVTNNTPATFRRFAGLVSTNNPEYTNITPAAFAQKLNLPADIQNLMGTNIEQNNTEILTLAQVMHALAA